MQKAKLVQIELIVFIAAILISAVAVFFYSPNFLKFNYNTLQYRSYLSDKYGLDSSELKVASYQRTYIQGPGFTESTSVSRTIPSKAMFKDSNNSKIYIEEYNESIIDDYQVEKIHDLAAKYFSKLLGKDIKVVILKDASNGSDYNNGLMSFITNGNDYIVDENNIEQFLIDFSSYSTMYKPGTYFTDGDMELNLYSTVEGDMTAESYIDSVNPKLSDFLNKTKLRSFTIWLTTDTDIKKTEIDLSGLDFKYINVTGLNNVKSRIMYGENGSNFRKYLDYTIDDRGIYFK